MSSKHHAGLNVAAQNQLVTWINEAGMVEGTKRVNLLRKIIEVLLHQIPQTIPTFVDNILTYTNDKFTDVKKLVISFIEEISKLHPSHLGKVVGQLRLLLTDSVVAVQKRAIQASSIVYRNTLLWICSGNASEDDMQYVWEQLSQLKLLVLNMIDSDNEGIRTHSIKFLEEVVLLQTVSDSPGSGDDEFSLNKFPDNLPFIRRQALEEESEHIFMLLIKFHNSQHISSVNLMACMTSLCLLAKFRPQYMPRVLQALMDLHTTLPPTLTQSQVNSVRKHLRMLLLNLMKHHTSNEMLPHITQLLLDIGMSPSEVNKALPKDKRNKRLGEIRVGDGPIKRMRIDSPQSNSQGSDSNSRGEFNFEESIQTKVPTEDTLFEGLSSVENVVSLVINTLEHHLPDDMPNNFINLYKPIPNAGSKLQKKTLAKMILSVINPEPVVPEQTKPVAETSKIPLLRDDDEKVTLKNAVAKLQETNKERIVENAVSKLMEETRQTHIREVEKQTKDQEKLVPPQTPTIPKLKQKVKLLKLQEITRPIPKEIKERMIIQAVARILNAEKDAAIGGAAAIRTKLITIFASSYTPELRELVLSHIFEDPAGRIDLALCWLYEEYAFMQGFNRHPVTLQPKLHEKHDQNYNQLFSALVTHICESSEPALESSRDMLLRRIYLESPFITEDGVEYLKHLASDERIMQSSLEILEEICIMRPPRAHKNVTALLSHVLNENEEVRNAALKSVVKLYKMSTDSLKKVVEKYAKLYLGFISLNQPPMDLFNIDSNRMKPYWSDDLYKLCLNLITMLFIENEDLIVEVGRVYGQANSDAKRCVLRAMEGPIRQLSSDQSRPAFIKLLDECPKGAETLLTRVIHILTEKAPPSPELVSRVRDLYATRVSDVRFLIPVLNGLTKKEILAALPKLIKLNPVVVKEVFNKLLGLQNMNDEILPVTPAELLVELHLIDPSKADLKYIIKATALCFAEKQMFTQDVLSLVLQRLMEEPEIPVLMMRTVLQALTLYPSLSGFVLNIMQRLIEKEIWSHKVAWEGWIKCAERTLPTSLTILVALPAAPFVACLSTAPSLKSALRSHVNSLTTSQKAALSPYVINEVNSGREYQTDQPFHLQGNPLIEPLPPGME